MAIQQINLGSMPLGVGGDSQRAANEKINQNFDTLKQFSGRSINGGGPVLTVGDFGIGEPTVIKDLITYWETNETPYINGMHKINHMTRVSFPVLDGWGYAAGIHFRVHDDASVGLCTAMAGDSMGILRTVIKKGDLVKTGLLLTSGVNAFADSNGFWKTSSPVVRVYANEINPNDDAKEQGVTFTRNGVGDYTLHNTLGLAQTGWQIELPQDNNRNPLVAIETEYTKDGDLNIRTYRRIFSMETFTFTCDYDNPLDIPEGRCVDVRLHEILPEEQLDESIE